MIRFNNDYSEGAHPKIIEKLIETNMVQTAGYGMDQYSMNARKLILNACEAHDGDVHFLVGGTQSNTVVISATLRPHECVISADSGHIATHETGAIESTGHHIYTLPNIAGKINATQVEEVMQKHLNDEAFEHTPKPGMIYISFPTETGTIYSKQELKDLYTVCQKYDLPLFVDGARLGYGLCAQTCDLTLPLIYKYSDVFYIGGTKVGAMFGEAVVIKKESLKKDFRYLIKRHGGMLAKGRLLGIQFETLFEDDLYLKISSNAINQAMRIKQAALKKNIQLYDDSYTNQQFLILSQTQIKSLEKKYVFSKWCDYENKVVVRFCTSWATKKEDVDQLLHDIKNL